MILCGYLKCGNYLPFRFTKNINILLLLIEQNLKKYVNDLITKKNKKKYQPH